MDQRACNLAQMTRRITRRRNVKHLNPRAVEAIHLHLVVVRYFIIRRSHPRERLVDLAFWLMRCSPCRVQSNTAKWHRSGRFDDHLIETSRDRTHLAFRKLGKLQPRLQIQG
jgi:hypothetical protein